MKIRSMSSYLGFLLMLLYLGSVGCGGAPGTISSPMMYEEVNVDIRDAEATRVLTGRSNLILVYARGLCCPSCSLGMRKTISRLSFVNTDAEKKGVILDPKHQLVYVTLKPGSAVVSSEIWQAVDDAGYDPVTIYRLSDGALQTEHFKGNELQ